MPTTSSVTCTGPWIDGVTASETWCLRPGQTLAYRHWDGEYVLYNDLSGDTHLLGDAAIELLLVLKAGPASRQALAAVLEAQFEIDPLELDLETGELLRHLQHLYLIDTRVDAPAC